MRAVALVLFMACNPGSTDTEPADTDASGVAPTTGTLRLHFAIDEDYRDAMDEPAAGTFYGSLWLADDVTGIGPNEGAESIADIEVTDVDLSSEPATAVLAELTDVPAGWVTVLGFLDSDDNHAGTYEPDQRDPVTLPAQNEIEVLGGETVEGEIFFGLLNP